MRSICLAMAAVMVGTGCGRHSVDAAHLQPAPAASDAAPSAYEQMGLIAVSGAFPFIGRVAYLAGAVPDSTWTVIALSFARHPLRTVDTRVTVAVERDGAVVRQVDGSLRDAWPVEDRAVFQRVLLLAPGPYTLSVTVRDTLNVHVSRGVTPLDVPRLDATAAALSSAIPVYRATPRYVLADVPAMIVNPRATVTAGRDSAIDIYLEGYGAGVKRPVLLQARTDSGVLVWRNSLTLRRRGELFSGVTPVPIAFLGPGIATLSFLAGDTVSTPVFVGLGGGIPVASFGTLLNALRYFAAPETLDSLRRAPAAARPAAWAAFSAPRADSLRAYLARVQQANDRFRDEGVPGWQTARGMVYVSLGDPYQIYMRGSAEREQIWVYEQYLTRIIFVDPGGGGRWQLTPRGASDFAALVHRLRQRPTP